MLICWSWYFGNFQWIAYYTWTLYRYNYTASATEHTLMFGFVCDSSRRRAWFFDDVSIVDTTEPSIELFENSSFDNSTIALTGWTQYCTSTCPSGAINAGKVVFGSNCTSTNCYADHCYGTGVIDFLSQTFPTTINDVYTISFRIIDYGSGTSCGNKGLCRCLLTAFRKWTTKIKTKTDC